MTDSVFRRIFRRNKQDGYFNYKRYVLDLQDLLKKAGNNAGGIADLRGLINRNADGAAFAAFFADDKKYNRCVLRQLTTRERIAVFDKVCVDEDYWWVKTQNVLLDLLETRDSSGKELEVLYLQGFRKNGYKWLREVWANEDVLTSRHRQRVLYAFIELFTQIEAARVDRVTTRTNLYHDEKGLHEFTYPVGIQEYYMGLSDNVFHFQGKQELVGYKDGLYGRMENDGRVYLNLWGTWRQTGAQYNQYISNKGDYSWKATEEEVFYADTLWPLELINVVPCGSYKGLDVFKPGEITSLPVLLVYFLERQRQKALEDERDSRHLTKMIEGVVLAASVIAVPVTGGTSLAVANLAVVSSNIAISEVDENINEAWESMTEEERKQHMSGYSAWKTFIGGWNTMNTALAAGGLASLARSGSLAISKYAGILRVNARFNNFVKSGSSFFAAIIKNTFGKPFTTFYQRMRRFVGWGASGAGKVAKYPINNFFEYVNHSFSATQKQLFEKAKKFYSSFNPSFNVNELRGIDFDMPVVNTVKRENNVMYQLSTIDPVTGKPRFGAYFFDDLNEDITKIGVGDLQRIKADGRVKVKIILSEDVEFLKTKTANIEDWNGTGTIFEGGGNQFYNPIAKQKIKSFEVIKTY